MRNVRLEVKKEYGDVNVTYAVESDDPQAAFHALNGIINQQEDLD